MTPPPQSFAQAEALVEAINRQYQLNQETKETDAKNSKETDAPLNTATEAGTSNLDRFTARALLKLNQGLSRIGSFIGIARPNFPTDESLTKLPVASGTTSAVKTNKLAREVASEAARGVARGPGMKGTGAHLHSTGSSLLWALLLLVPAAALAFLRYGKRIPFSQIIPILAKRLLRLALILLGKTERRKVLDALAKRRVPRVKPTAATRMERRKDHRRREEINALLRNTRAV